MPAYNFIRGLSSIFFFLVRRDDFLAGMGLLEGGGMDFAVIH
jgi:hypothetical protein